MEVSHDAERLAAHGVEARMNRTQREWLILWGLAMFLILFFGINSGVITR